MFERFNVPKDWKSFESRIFANLMYYASNYMLVGLGLSLWQFLNPRVLLSVIPSVLLGAYLLGAREKPIFLPGRRKAANEGERRLITLIFSFLLLLFTGALWTVLYTLVLITSITLLHASLRPENMKSKLNKVTPH